MVPAEQGAGIDMGLFSALSNIFNTKPTPVRTSSVETVSKTDAPIVEGTIVYREYVRTPYIHDDYNHETLRALKLYDEKGGDAGPFSLKGIRRHHSSSHEWWAEGRNFESAAAALKSLMKLSGQTKNNDYGFVNTINFIVSRAKPFKPGIDGVYVPIIRRPTAKSFAGMGEVEFNFDGRQAIIVVNADGFVMKAKFRYNHERHLTIISASYSKNESALLVKSIKVDGDEVFNEREMERQAKRAEIAREEMKPLMGQDGLVALVRESLSAIKNHGANISGALKALEVPRGTSALAEYSDSDIRLTIKTADGSGFLMKARVSPGFVDMKYWSARGVPDYEYSYYTGKGLTFAKIKGNRIK